MKTCLVVDDSRVIRKVAAKIATSLGYVPVEAQDGHEALARGEVARSLFNLTNAAAEARRFGGHEVPLDMDAGVFEYQTTTASGAKLDLSKADPDQLAVLGGGGLQRPLGGVGLGGLGLQLGDPLLGLAQGVVGRHELLVALVQGGDDLVRLLLDDAVAGLGRTAGGLVLGDGRGGRPPEQAEGAERRGSEGLHGRGSGLRS